MATSCICSSASVPLLPRSCTMLILSVYCGHRSRSVCPRCDATTPGAMVIFSLVLWESHHHLARRTCFVGVPGHRKPRDHRKVIGQIYLHCPSDCPNKLFASFIEVKLTSVTAWPHSRLLGVYTGRWLVARPPLHSYAHPKAVTSPGPGESWLTWTARSGW